MPGWMITAEVWLDDDDDGPRSEEAAHAVAAAMVEAAAKMDASETCQNIERDD